MQKAIAMHLTFQGLAAVHYRYRPPTDQTIRNRPSIVSCRKYLCSRYLPKRERAGQFLRNQKTPSPCISLLHCRLRRVQMIRRSYFSWFIQKQASIMNGHRKASGGSSLVQKEKGSGLGKVIAAPARANLVWTTDAAQTRKQMFFTSIILLFAVLFRGYSELHSEFTQSFF